MKIKKGLKISTTDFWYDLTDGGYLDPMDICESQEDGEKVREAIKILCEFQTSCEHQIKDFFQ